MTNSSPVHLGVEERVRDPERHLVAELQHAQRVADDQDIRHPAPIYPRPLADTGCRSASGAGAGRRSAHVSADLRALRERLAEGLRPRGARRRCSSWDQRVQHAPLGGPARAEAVATARPHRARPLRGRRDPGSLLERLRPLEESLEYDSDDASPVRVTRRDWDKERRVPSKLRTEMLRRASRGTSVSVDARAANDFSSFLQVLERNLELRRRYVECFGWDDSPYAARRLSRS